MTLEELNRLNSRFQQKAGVLVELFPGSNFLNDASGMIRSSRKLDQLLKRILTAKTEISFYKAIDGLEEEIDEIIFFLDKLDNGNRLTKSPPVTDFVKTGYDLLSYYSKCCDQILEKKLIRKPNTK